MGGQKRNLVGDGSVGSREDKGFEGLCYCFEATKSKQILPAIIETALNEAGKERSKMQPLTKGDMMVVDGGWESSSGGANRVADSGGASTTLETRTDDAMGRT